MKDKWKTGVNSCAPRHPEWDASPETEAKSSGPGMQPFERSKNPIQVNLFGEQEGVQRETEGDKTLGKADTPSNKGKQEGAEWETKGDKIQEREARRGTRGDKTLGKADTRSNTKADTLRKH